MNQSIIILYLNVLVALAIAQPPRELNYALFTSGFDSSFDSSGSVPAIEIAEEQILNEPSLLSRYTLHHTSVQDTRVRKTTC